MKSIPFVSIVLPTYNRLPKLKRAVSSVINQTHPSWELIIINDGCTDGTDAYLSSLRKNNKIKIRSHRRDGVVPTAIGLRMAKGIYVTFLDDDDYYLPRHLSNANKVFERNPELGMLHGVPSILGPKSVANIHPPHNPISIRACVVGGTLFIKNEIVCELKKLPAKKYGNDYFLHKAVRDLGYRCKKISMPTYVYDRRGKNSITKKELEKQKTTN